MDKNKTKIGVTIIFHFTVLAIILPTSVIVSALRLLLYPLAHLWKNFRTLFKAYVGALPERTRKHLKYYDQFGLKHSITYLQYIDWKQMVHWDIEDMLEYADEHTVKRCSKTGKEIFMIWIAKKTGAHIMIEDNYQENSLMNMAKNCLNTDSTMMNATTIGNLGYLAAYSPTEAEREDAFNTIYWLREQAQKDI